MTMTIEPRQATSRPGLIYDRRASLYAPPATSTDELDAMRHRLLTDGFAEVVNGMNADVSEARIAFDEAISRYAPPLLLRCRECAGEFTANASTANPPTRCRECRNRRILAQGAADQIKRRKRAAMRPKVSKPKPEIFRVPKIDTGKCPSCGGQPKIGQIYCSRTCSDNRFRNRIRAEVVSG
jgi:hypothetical protein